MNLAKITFLFSLLLLFHGCGEDAQVTLYDTTVKAHPPHCLKLDIFPPDPAIEKTARGLYPFADSCPFQLSLSYKNGIRCNSNANAPRKTLSNFPSAYLRLELRKGMKLFYSYYRDLTHPVEADDLKEAFRRFREDVPLPEASKP